MVKNYFNGIKGTGPLRAILFAWCVIAVLFFALFSPPSVKAQSQLGNYTTDVRAALGVTNMPSGATSNFTAFAFNPRPGYGIGIQIAVTNTTATTSNIVLYGSSSIDGTNYPTTPTWTNSIAMNGTTLVETNFVIPASQLDPFKTFSIRSIQNTAGSGTATITRFIISRPVSQR